MEKKYLKRYMDDDLERYLRMIGAILIVGPKWCGKTTTAEKHANSVIKLQDTTKQETYKLWSEINPPKLLEGKRHVAEYCSGCWT
ncbi:MAG: hypothetical protein E7Z86_08510 [Methanosphaera stadtmanae]|nr:hypothetical protein [Methanosphaera stadtmanae]